MSEVENTKRVAETDEDWAIIPFDEAEDDARWAKLSEEMDELIEKTESTEKLIGTILMEEEFNPNPVNEAPDQTDDKQADDEQLF